MKKHLLLLIIAVFFSTASAFAQIGGTTGALTWELDLTSNTLTISGNGEMPDYEWGEAPWYEYREDIGIVVIETGVATIGDYAFLNCTNLTSITIPNSVITIGVYAFHTCESLTLITIPNSVTTIGTRAFQGCINLISIIIPSSVTTIGDAAFLVCTSLTSINVETGNSAYASENGVLFDKTKTTLICCPAGKTADTYVIPNSVVTIAVRAFFQCTNLTTITISNSVTTVEDAAFRFCTGLTTITIPSTVTTIGDRAFQECTSLTLIINLNPVPIEINPDVFGSVNQNECTLEVPIASVSDYQNANVWKEFNIVGIEVGIKTIETPIVKIYPNPTTGKLRIDSGEWRMENVTIYDAFGKIQKMTKQENAIDISHFSAGVYFVKISTEAGEVVRKVVKE